MADVKTSSSGRRYVDVDEVITNRLKHIHADAEIASKVKIGICACSTRPPYTCSAHEAIESALATAQSNLAREVLEYIEIERLHDTANRGDAAYNQAIDDVLESVRCRFTKLGISVDEGGE